MIRKLVVGLLCNQLDLKDLSEIEVDCELYYQVKDLNNGNLIAINNRGEVYGLIHSPYKIELLNKSIKSFVEEVNNGDFNLTQYTSQKEGNA